jgi:hypothetical protein
VTQQHTFPMTRSHSPMGSSGLHQTETEFHGRYYEHTFEVDDVMDNDETAGYGDQEFIRTMSLRFLGRSLRREGTG